MSGKPGRFNRFAEAVAAQVARAWFFTVCVLMVVVWAPSLPVWGSVDTWQLIINTATTIITFLLVALLHNTQHRTEGDIVERQGEMVEHLRRIEFLLDRGDGR